MAGIELDGANQKVVLDADGDTYLEAATDDTIKVYVAGAHDATISANAINVLSGTTLTIDSGATIANSGTATGFGSNVPSSADGQALGSASAEWSDLFLADGGIIKFGNDQDVLLTHVADTGLLLSGTNVIQFNDASQNIGAPSATVLDINATDEIELNATLLDVNANLDVSGTTLLPTLGVITAKDLGVGIHVRTADASQGSVNANADELILENSAGCGITILSGASNLGRIAFGDSGDGAIAFMDYNHSTNELSLTGNGNAALKIDSTGAVTKPLNPAFMTQQTGALSVADGHTIFSTNTTERYDVNSDISGATFTAPVTGKYQLNFCVLYESVTSDTTFEPKLQTSNRTYASPPQTRAANGDGTYLGTTGSYLCDMDANDTAIVVHVGPTADVSVSANWSWFTGTLIG